MDPPDELLDRVLRPTDKFFSLPKNVSKGKAETLSNGPNFVHLELGGSMNACYS